MCLLDDNLGMDIMILVLKFSYDIISMECIVVKSRLNDESLLCSPVITKLLKFVYLESCCVYAVL